jgi:hypothetical protein
VNSVYPVHTIAGLIGLGDNTHRTGNKPYCKILPLE